MKHEREHLQEGMEREREREREGGSTVRFYRIRSNVNPLLGSTITRSKVIASTVLMSKILRSTQNDLHQNCFYIIDVYRS